jgi:GTP cyclohydrolase I
MYDVELGSQISNELKRAGIETPVMLDKLLITRSRYIANHFQSIMELLGLDMGDDSLKDTPARIGKMYVNEVFRGLDYGYFPKCTTVINKMHYDEVIISDGIDVLSMCEHHFVPFIGKAYVGYIPDTKVLGLSKFNRVVDFFARRPQVQERLTEQIHLAFRYILDTADVALVIRAQHYCVKLRGVKQTTTTTVTSKVSGRFKEKEALRAEFLSLIRDNQ